MKKIPAALKSIVAGGLFGAIVTSMLLYTPNEVEPNNHEVSSIHYDINQKQALQRSTNSAVRVFP